MLPAQLYRFGFTIAGMALLSFSCKGQILQGFIRDSTGSPVAFATVAVSYLDGAVLSYTTANESGSFRLSFQTNTDSLLISARCLGYIGQTVPLARPDWEHPVEITLTPIGMPLREVVVREEALPVVVRNDTIEYNAASFSDSTEFSVEDLLKKLPGIQVNENGTITLNGQPVEKVMIEGDDLFGNNYQLATRNVRANNISRIQAIQNYQDNPLMKRFQESNRLVLNLVFKEEKKRANSGSMVVGSGYGDEVKGFLHLNLFSLSRKDKLYLIGNANNTGENSLGNISSFGRDLNAGGSNLQDNPLRPQSPVNRPAMEQNGLPAPFTQTNRTGLLFLGHILPFSPTGKIRLSAWAGRETLRQNARSDTRYLLDSELLQITESKTQRHTGNLFNAQAETEWAAPDGRHLLRGFVKMEGAPQQFSALYSRQSAATDQKINTDQEDKNRSGFAAFEYTTQLDSTNTLLFSAKYADIHNVNALISEYPYYPFFFMADTDFTKLAQDCRYGQSVGNTYIRWLRSTSRFIWSFDAGYHHRNEQLGSGFTLHDNTNDTWQPADASAQNESLTVQKWYSSGSIARTWGPIYSRLRLRIARIQVLSNTQRNPTYWAPESSFYLRYEPDTYNSLDISYQYDLDVPFITQVFSSPLFTDYQSLRRGLPDYTLLPGHKGRIHYRFNDPIKQFAWNLGASARYAPEAFGNRFDIDPYLSIQEGFRPAPVVRYSLDGSASRFFPFISSRVELGVDLSSSRGQSRVNSDALRTLDSRTMSGKLSYGTGFDGWVNGILTNQLLLFTSINHTNGVSTNLSTRFWSSALTLTIEPTPKLDIKLNLYRADTRSAGVPPMVFWAADGVCSWFVPRWRSFFQLSGFNLLNTRLFEQGLSDGFYQINTGIFAVRPFFLFTWDHSF